MHTSFKLSSVEELSEKINFVGLFGLVPVSLVPFRFVLVDEVDPLEII